MYRHVYKYWIVCGAGCADVYMDKLKQVCGHVYRHVCGYAAQRTAPRSMSVCLMRVHACLDIYVGMAVDMCADLCAGVCLDTCLAMCTDACIGGSLSFGDRHGLLNVH